MNDDLAAKTLREKCVKGDAHKMVSHLDNLGELGHPQHLLREARKVRGGGPQASLGVQEVQSV